MDTTTSLGRNRTGAATSPNLTRIATEGAAAAGANPAGGRGALAEYRRDAAREAERLGAVPIPTTLTGLATTLFGKLKGDRPEILVDKLGERLAYERSGARLYEAVIDKLGALGEGAPVPLSELYRIRDDELRHVDMLWGAMRDLGLDPTAQTPCADASAVATSGVLALAQDPRSTPTQALQALLIAELVDDDAWQTLDELCAGLGHDALAKELATARAQEAEHLRTVRGLLRSVLMGAAGA